MGDLLPFIVSGVATGAIYGLAGTGLVLTYKTSGLFNFGHGAIAAVGAYVFYWMHIDHEVDWKLAFFVGVVVVGVVLGLVMEVVSAHLSRQRTAMKIVGTIGIVLLVQALATIKYGEQARFIPQYLPKGDEHFRILGVNITYDLVIITAIALVAVAALYALFRRSRMGIEMRAVVDDPDLLTMQGTSPARVRRSAWLIGSIFAALSGVLVAPLLGLHATVLTFLVVQAFGAAAIGYLSSIPLTFAGGLIIGVIADVSKKYVIEVDWLAGLPSSLPFIALFIVLLVIPREKLVPPSLFEARPPLQYRGPAKVRLVAGVLVLLPLLLVPQLVGAKLAFFTVALVNVIMLLSLGLLVRTSGQVSLAHATFAAVGAVAFSQLAVEQGFPWLLAVLSGGLIAVPVGVVIAIPAIRLSGLFLALATFGFGILVQRLFYAQWIMFTPFDTGRRMPRPSLGSSPEGYYYVVLAFVVATALLMVAIHHGRIGRLLRGMSDSGTAVTTMGLSTNVSRVIVFSISAFLAGVAGVLYGISTVFASGGSLFYTPFNSLVLLAMLALAPFAEPWYALVAIASVIPGYIAGQNTVHWLNAAFGLAAIVIAMRGSHPPMPLKLRAFLDRFGTPKEESLARGRELAGEAPVSVARAEDPGLEVEELTVRFGGLVAVNSLSFEAPMNRITGLIGPNGAGKTTSFNVCSGLNRSFDGRVLLHGEDVTALSPAARGRRGLGRTFQRFELCDTLTVFENVALGRESGLAGARPGSQLFARPSDWHAVEASAWSAMELCGISDLAWEQAGALSTGQRRLVELARCLAGPFDMLLLDEPSSGLDGDETARFGELLQRVVEERSLGILLVEHDMALVMHVCSYIYVLDFGELIYEGDPSAVASSEVVQAAYLGSESVMEAAEGVTT